MPGKLDSILNNAKSAEPTSDAFETEIIFALIARPIVRFEIKTMLPLTPSMTCLLVIIVF